MLWAYIYQCISLLFLWPFARAVPFASSSDQDVFIAAPGNAWRKDNGFEPHATPVNFPSESPDYPVAYDSSYDTPGGSTSHLACARALSGRFPSFRDIPSYPHIGGASFASSSSSSSSSRAGPSAHCGSCWHIVYPPTGASANVTIVDRAATAFALTKEALGALVGGRVEKMALGKLRGLRVEATPVPADACGL
ncbi:hypothetical protein OF83DRAFT_1069096 [Amylostereum chailletii]|nr:hypothetical protein OF83DRAFT_1069096 [Amylostereum chailletii]